MGYIVVLMFFFSFSFLKLICVHLALCMCISFLPQMPVLLLCIVLHGNFFLDIMKCYLFIHSVFKFLIAREHFDCFVHWYWMQIQRTDSSFRIFAYFFLSSFCAQPQSGAEFRYIDKWSSSFTWGGESPPVAGDLVQIPSGQIILLDVNTPVLTMLIIEGRLGDCWQTSCMIHRHTWAG